VSTDCAYASPAAMPVHFAVNGPASAALRCGTQSPADCDWLTYAEGFGYASTEEFWVGSDE